MQTLANADYTVNSAGVTSVREYDIYCPEMGKHTHKKNYYRSSCDLRLGSFNCRRKDCPRYAQKKGNAGLAAQPHPPHRSGAKRVRKQ